MSQGAGSNDRKSNDRNPAPADVTRVDREALGRSRGGLSTKIHLPADARCRPLARVTTAGQRHESKAFEPTMARRLVHRRRGQRRWPRRLAADKGYSYPRIRRWCRRRRIEATIPTRSNQPRDEHFDKAADALLDALAKLTSALGTLRS